MRRLASVTALGAALLAASPAIACGGFFCDSAGVDQVGEEIVFSIADGVVDVTIRIDYDGAAEDFAWVLPLPAEPEEIGTGVVGLFDVLRGATQPQWQVTIDDNGCGPTVGTGDCCNPGDGVGCADPACQSWVCADDPFCCETQWDSICANAAVNECNSCGGWGGGGGGGGGGAADCCAPGFGPGCDDPECSAAVCGQDAFCCDTEWDQICADAAFDICGGCDGSPALPPVDVLDTGQVGPFDFAVLKSADPDELLSWLDDNGYVQPADTQDLVGHYIDMHFVFVAFKLKKDAQSGDIVPVRLRFPADDGCVPLVLTAIAAQPGMPITVWVLGGARAVPKNWLHVKVNPKRLSWQSASENVAKDLGYSDLLPLAVDEAAGRAFATEYAGSSSVAHGQLYTLGKYKISQLRKLTDPADWIAALPAAFGSPPAELMAIMQEHVPLPASLAAQGVTPAQFYNWPWNYPDEYAAIDFDPTAATAALHDRIVVPAREAEHLLRSQRYLTRLANVISPDEMTRDALFTFNPDLPKVPRVRDVHLSLACDEAGVVSGQYTTQDGLSWYGPLPPKYGVPTVQDDLSEEPYGFVELLGTSGPPIPIDLTMAIYVDFLLDVKFVDEVIELLALD